MDRELTKEIHPEILLRPKTLSYRLEENRRYSDARIITNAFGAILGCVIALGVDAYFLSKWEKKGR